MQLDHHMKVLNLERMCDNKLNDELVHFRSFIARGAKRQRVADEATGSRAKK